MVTIYRSTDTDAPALPASGNYNQAGFFMDVLKACLVDGYGSKAAAGWSIDYEDTTAENRRIAFSNGNGILELVTWGTASLGMFLWESISTPGTGRISDADWATVTSEGTNGWQHEQIPMPGSESEYCMGLYVPYLHQGYASDYAWTVYADEKSAWILFHYPEGHSSSEPSDQPARGSYYPELFIGAVKSADITRNETGNFFLGYGGVGTPTSSAASSGSQAYLSYFWGLRAPMGTAPSAGANPRFDPKGFEFNGYMRNPLSSARLLLPVLISYAGTDTPGPGSLTSSYKDYQFATLPGVAQIGKGDNGDNFWPLYQEENDGTWSHDPHTIGGSVWMPWTLGQNFLREVGITDDANWWT